MNLYCTLENEMYKYSYGNYNPWQVPFKERENIALTCAQNDSVATQLLLYSHEECMITLDSVPAFMKLILLRRLGLK